MNAVLEMHFIDMQWKTVRRFSEFEATKYRIIHDCIALKKNTKISSTFDIQIYLPFERKPLNKIEPRHSPFFTYYHGNLPLQMFTSVQTCSNRRSSNSYHSNSS